MENRAKMQACLNFKSTHEVSPKPTCVKRYAKEASITFGYTSSTPARNGGCNQAAKSLVMKKSSDTNSYYRREVLIAK